MPGTFGYQLKACGKRGVPKYLKIASDIYRLDRIFKHDFFALTALYALCSNNSNYSSQASPKLVLKMARTEYFAGFPLQLLGQWLCQREWAILRRLQHIPQVPHLVARFGRYAFLYRFIEGRSLDEKPALPDHFFDQLETLIMNIHQEQIAYIDMNKRGNILLGEDQKPYLIDFQIACHIHCPVWGFRRLTQEIRNILQSEDIYHLYKHKRRLRPDLMDKKQLHCSRKFSSWIAIHRIFAGPLKSLRRRILGMLYRDGHLADGGVDQVNPETDPARWRRH